MDDELIPQLLPPSRVPQRIDDKYSSICDQFIVNLLATGYRIINPDGDEITEELLKTAGMKTNGS